MLKLSCGPSRQNENLTESFGPTTVSSGSGSGSSVQISVDLKCPGLQGNIGGLFGGGHHWIQDPLKRSQAARR